MTKSSGCIGVRWSSTHEKWQAEAWYEGATFYLGLDSNKRYLIEKRKKADRMTRDAARAIKVIEDEQKKKIEVVKNKLIKGLKRIAI